MLVVFLSRPLPSGIVESNLVAVLIEKRVAFSSSWILPVPRRACSCNKKYAKFMSIIAMKWLVFEAAILHSKVMLGRGQPGLIGWILLWIMPWVSSIANKKCNNYVNYMEIGKIWSLLSLFLCLQPPFFPFSPRLQCPHTPPPPPPTQHKTCNMQNLCQMHKTWKYVSSAYAECFYDITKYFHLIFWKSVLPLVVQSVTKTHLEILCMFIIRNCHVL